MKKMIYLIKSKKVFPYAVLSMVFLFSSCSFKQESKNLKNGWVDNNTYRFMVTGKPSHGLEKKGGVYQKISAYENTLNMAWSISYDKFNLKPPCYGRTGESFSLCQQASHEFPISGSVLKKEFDTNNNCTILFLAIRKRK